MHEPPPSPPGGPTPNNPYQAVPLNSNSAEDASAAVQWPIIYQASQSQLTGVALPLASGLLMITFGLVMFLLHLFVIDGNQIGLHLSATLPIIGGVFLLMSAWSNSRSVRELRLWPEGIELIRSTTQTVAWDSVHAIRVADSTNPGTLNQKVITLAGADNEPVGTISGSFKQHEEIVQQIRSITGLPEAPSGLKQTASEAGKKKGRRTALLTGLGALLLGSAGVFLPIKAYSDYTAARLMETSGVLSTGTVSERIVAPNGRTLRIRYTVTGSDGATAVHNVEVSEAFFAEVVVGDEVPIRTVPDRPDISELVNGEVQSSDLLDTPVASLILGIIGIIATAFMIPVAVLSWNGYDIDFAKGRFKIVALE